MDRKYRHRGYQDSGKPEKKKERPPQQRPRGEFHQGPHTPRMVGSVTRARCSDCGTVLAPGFDVTGKCPKCNADLHACKQCRHFDTGAQFECTKPIPACISKKDAANDCSFFEFRVTIEKDTAPTSYSSSPAPPAASPTRPNDPRQAFENLFKK